MSIRRLSGRGEDPTLEAGTLAGDKKKAQAEGRTIVFIDESGLSERPHCCRTWAPRGQTPVLQYHFNWKTLSAIAGVSWWNFYFRLFPGAIRTPQIIAFLSHLLRHIPGKLLIVWDGLPGHRSRITWEFIRQQRERLWVEFSPRLRAGTESGGVFVVPLEAARVAQLLSSELRAIEPLCPTRSAADAPAIHVGDRFFFGDRQNYFPCNYIMQMSISRRHIANTQCHLALA